ncbi:MAG: YciI family protein [Actinomycetes bacterium]
MKYVILMQVDPSVLEGLSEEEGQRIQSGHHAFMEATKESGEFLATNALADPSQSVVVRGKAGSPEVTDGPFAETKEFMGGYYLVDVEDRARAVELATMIPDAQIDGMALEIRPVMFSAGADM